VSDYPLQLEVDLTRDTETRIDEWRKLTKSVVKDKEFNKSLQDAVNRALSAARTRSEQVAKRGYTVDKGEIKRATFPRKASYSGSGELTAVLEFKGGRIPAVKFTTPVQTPEGVRVQFKTGGGGTVQSAFMGRPFASRGQVNEGVYIRKYRGMGSAALGIPGTSGRFPISTVTGPAVVSMVGHEAEAAEIQERARQILDKRIDVEMKRMLTGKY
jgi:hypothetical protein